MTKRFTDTGESLYYFQDHRIVKCLGCERPVNFINLRISCVRCGYNKDFETDGERFKILRDTVPLENYLSIPCCGQTLGAVNLDHLDFLEEYVGANLRERIPNINKSMASRLPKWIKDKKNREPILKAIGKLRQQLKQDGYTRPNAED